MNLTKKRMLIILLNIILVLVLFISFYKFPKTINLNYPAVEFRTNEETIRNTTIHNQGTLYRPLFRNKVFKGHFVINSYDFTKNYNLMDIVFYKSIRNGWGSLSYVLTKNGNLDLQTFGSIWINDNFDKLKIQVYEPIWNERKSFSNLIICAPAQTLSEGLLINNSIQID